MDLAIVHEWFETYAGSERVIEQLLNAYPEADLHALVDFLPTADRGAVKHKQINTSFIQRLPLARKAFRNYLPLMPSAIEQFNFSDYDAVLSSNHAFAKGVITRPDQMHVSYVHTPIRYGWELQHEYLEQAKLKRGLKSMFVRMTLHYLRLWDRLTSDRVDAYVANSRYIAQRIQKTYRRKAYVVYPPVDVDAFSVGTDRDDFYLAASRMVPYKRIDLLVQAFAQMPNRRLVVIGDGPEMKRIAAQATPNVTLLGYQPFEVLLDHMQRAKAFMFAAEEDFGIMPVEAQACGTPVIAYGRGGALETVVDGKTGLFFDQQTPNAVAEAVVAFESQSWSMSPGAIRDNALRFRPERFRREMSQLIDRLWARFQKAQLGQANRAFPLDPVRRASARKPRVASAAAAAAVAPAAALATS